MSEEIDQYTGRCMCGAVRFAAKSSPSGIYHCHCESCRRHTGASLSTMAVFKAEQVEFSGNERKRYECSPGVHRGFCIQCGTSMTWETDHPRFGLICSLHIGIFDNPGDLQPEAHSFYGERPDWMDVADCLPRYGGLVGISELISYGPIEKN